MAAVHDPGVSLAIKDIGQTITDILNKFYVLENYSS